MVFGKSRSYEPILHPGTPNSWEVTGPWTKCSAQCCWNKLLCNLGELELRAADVWLDQGNQWCSQMCCLSHCLLNPVTALHGSARVAAPDPGCSFLPIPGMPYLGGWIPFILCPVASELANQKGRQCKGINCPLFLIWYPNPLNIQIDFSSSSE